MSNIINAVERFEFVSEQIIKKLNFEMLGDAVYISTAFDDEDRKFIKNSLDLIKKDLKLLGVEAPGGHYWQIILKKVKKHGSLENAIEHGNAYKKFNMALTCLS